jgi:uncharacterized protein
MQCPACGKGLSPVQAEAVTVDVCREGCGGMWFDQLELKRIENSPAAAQVLLDLEVPSPVTYDQGVKRHCPKCEDVVMMQTFNSSQRQVRLDHCPNCGGHWLDTGELKQIRSLYESPEERETQVKSMLDGAFGNELDAMALRRERVSERYSLINGLFRYLTR